MACAADCFALMCEVLVNVLIHQRGVYPSSLFRDRKVFGVILPQCVHPLVSGYLARTLAGLKPMILAGKVRCIIVQVLGREKVEGKAVAEETRSTDGVGDNGDVVLEEFVLHIRCDWISRLEAHCPIHRGTERRRAPRSRTIAQELEKRAVADEFFDHCRDLAVSLMYLNEIHPAKWSIVPVSGARRSPEAKNVEVRSADGSTDAQGMNRSTSVELTLRSLPGERSATANTANVLPAADITDFEPDRFQLLAECDDAASGVVDQTSGAIAWLSTRVQSTSRPSRPGKRPRDVDRLTARRLLATVPFSVETTDNSTAGLQLWWRSGPVFRDTRDIGTAAGVPDSRHRPPTTVDVVDESQPNPSPIDVDAE